MRPIKLNTIFALLLFCCFTASGQDVNEILQQSYNKCQSVKNGYYEMARYWKSVSKKDTSRTLFNCYFKKLDDDTLFSSAFHYKAFLKDGSIADVMYTGEDFVTTSIQDSSAVIMSTSKWAREIKAYSNNYKFYSPLTNRKSSPLLADSANLDNKHIFRFIGEEIMNGDSCYHIQENEVPENESNGMLKILRIEIHYWIRKNDFIPVQYSIALDIVMNKDTMYQYERNELNHYEVNHLQDENFLTLNSIPSFCRIKDFVPFDPPELLPEGTMAPDWELISLTNQNISLKSLEGQLVLIDFFYKSCYPCMQALPILQALSEKYKHKGLRVIGIDPFDTTEDDITTFLSKRGVTYTVFLAGKETAGDYHVSGYPTLYLVDRTGKIIYQQAGFRIGDEEILDEIIKKNLE